MSKLRYYGGVAILIVFTVLAFLVPVGCKKSIKSEPEAIAQSNSEHIKRVKKWYSEEWRNQVSGSARVSPWLHDTSFIINNYSNLVLDWQVTRVIQQGNATYTEVLAYVADTLEFKIGTTDTTQLTNLLSDNSYTTLTQSKIIWLLKEVPNEDPIVEIVTFIGDYDYVLNNRIRFLTGISYFDLADYTGVVLYHGRDGRLIRSFQYDKGALVNTIRCGVEGGLDPDPGNRVHLDVCLEILTWERECTTVYSDEFIGEKVCGSWFLMGSRMVGNCWSSGGGGGSENYTPYAEDGMDCITFLFSPTGGNWQEAGVINSRVKILWLGAGPNAVYQYINVTITAPIIIGMPRYHGGGTVSQGRAAEIAAWACDQAVKLTSASLKLSPTRPTNLEIETLFRRQLNNLMLLQAGKADRIGTGSPGIFIGNAKYRFFGNGDCDD